jgi:prophage regulatory protein
VHLLKPELEEWVREYHPELVRLRGQRLLFSEEVLRSLYSTEPGPVPLERAGAPGRPSSMHLILNEFERRRAAGSCENSRSAEAERLAAWLKETHPDNPRGNSQDYPQRFARRLPACSKLKYRAPFPSVFRECLNRYTSDHHNSEVQMLRRILRLPQVVEATGETRSTIYKRIAEGEFPKPVRLGAKSVGWVEDEIAEYNERRIRARDWEFKAKEARNVA